MKNKKKIYLLIIIFFTGFILSAQTKNVTVWVMPTEAKGLTVAESNWLPKEVHNALRANITNYSGLTVVEENSDLLASIQAKSYNINISEKDSVRMGKQIGANHVIRSTVTKNGNGYSLTVIMQILESGTHLAESNQTVKKADDLYGHPGCAVNEATIEICDRLSAKYGTGLSSMEKRILRKGDIDLTNEEEIAYLKEVEKKQQELIASLNKKIATIDVSTSNDAAAETARLKAQRDQAAEKQKQANERSKRLAEEALRRQKDLELQKSRSKAQQERISKAEQEIQNKVKKLREKNFKTSNLLTQISSIEAKKEALLDIRLACEIDEEKFIEEYKKAYQQKYTEIIEAPLRAAEKDKNGVMLPIVEKSRKDQLEQENKKLIEERENAIKKSKQIVAEVEKELIPQIKEQSEALTVKRTADNIKKDLFFEVGVYDGQSKTWDVNAILTIEGQMIYTYPFKLSYEKLTGKTANALSAEYVDNVDYYSSLFAKSMPVTAVMTFHVEACPESEPSRYRFVIETLQLSHTEDGKVFETKTINETVKKQFEPIHDIRDDSVIHKSKANRDYYAEFNQKKHGNYAGRLGVGGGVSYDIDSKIGFDAWLNIPVGKYFFVGANLGLLPIAPKIEKYTSNYEAFYWDTGVGVNKRLLFLLPPNCYAFIGIGGYGYKYGNGYDDLDWSVEDKSIRSSLPTSYFLLKTDIGTEIPLYTPTFNLVLDFSAFWVPSLEYIGAKVSVGFSLSYIFGVREWLKSLKY